MKIVEYGMGNLSKHIIKYINKNGWEIVGAFDRNEELFSKDISFVTGDKTPYNIKIKSSVLFEECLSQEQPDIAIIATNSTLTEIYYALNLCAKYGVDVITSCQEALFPKNSNSELFLKLDDLAKQNNITIIATGTQELIFANLITSITKCTNDIKKITYEYSTNLNDFGSSLIKDYGIGLTLSEFEKTIKNKYNFFVDSNNEISLNNFPSILWNLNGFILDRLGFSIKRQKQEIIPIITNKKIEDKNMMIDSGDCKGISCTVTSYTKEKVVLKGKFIFTIDDDKSNKNFIKIDGDPETKIKLDKFDTKKLTAGLIVNKIPYTLKSKPGFIYDCFVINN